MLKIEISVGEGIAIGEGVVIMLEAKSGQAARLSIEASSDTPIRKLIPSDDEVLTYPQSPCG